MKRKGLTIIEMISALSIITICILLSMKFYNLTQKNLNILDERNSIEADIRIATEFLCEKVRNSTTLYIGNGEATIDGERVFVKDNILRCKTASVQIAPNIVRFALSTNDNKLYKLTVFGENKSNTTFIERREKFEFET